MIDEAYIQMLMELFGDCTDINGDGDFDLKILRGRLVDLLCLDGYSKHQASELLDRIVNENSEFLFYESFILDNYPRMYVTMGE